MENKRYYLKGFYPLDYNKKELEVLIWDPDPNYPIETNISLTTKEIGDLMVFLKELEYIGNGTSTEEIMGSLDAKAYERGLDIYDYYMRNTDICIERPVDY